MSEIREEVLVVPATEIRYITGGFCQSDPLSATFMFRFLCRGIAEQISTVKQIIAYGTFIKRREEGGPPEVLSYLRSKADGEARLRGQYSVGIGGHISKLDCLISPRSTIYHAAKMALAREVTEELGIGFDVASRICQVGAPGSPTLSIYLGDKPDAPLVDQVHVGLCWILPFSEELMTGVPQLKELRLRPARHLAELPLENWSTEVIHYLRGPGQKEEPVGEATTATLD